MQIQVISIEYLEKEYPTRTPVLTYCRKLAKDGVDPKMQLQVTRMGTTTLIVNDIYEAAKLTVKEEPTVHFAKWEDKSYLKQYQKTPLLPQP